jgi:glycosyltransferase involved in cell wall biosynthesis
MKLSVVTPSFRQPLWLKLCIASVADQLGVECEHIVQEGGGDDDDIQLLARERPAVRMFVEPDEGMYDAVNRGLRRATGAICSYLNCDEQYLPGTLDTVAAFFEAHSDIEVLFGDAVLVNRAGVPISYRRAIIPHLTHTRLAHLNTLSCAMFFRRSLITRGYFFDPKLKDVGDVAWIETLLKARVPMATLRQPLAVFAFTGENRSVSEVAKAELSQRGKSSNALTTIQRTLAVLHHRIRKTMAGAYRRRRVAVDIYTLDSPEKRRRMSAESVSFRWPSN